MCWRYQTGNFWGLSAMNAAELFLTDNLFVDKVSGGKVGGCVWGGGQRPNRTEPMRCEK